LWGLSLEIVFIEDAQILHTAEAIPLCCIGYTHLIQRLHQGISTTHPKTQNNFCWGSIIIGKKNQTKPMKMEDNLNTFENERRPQYF
jgi:hypothetical protein